MTITGPQKSRTVRARDKAPVKPTKAGTKPGPKTKGPRTAARFEKDGRRQDLTYHDWVQVFDYIEEHDASQKEFLPTRNSDVEMEDQLNDSEDPAHEPSASPAGSDSEPASTLHAAWNVVLHFATTSCTYPEAEKGVRAVLGEAYIPSEWKCALDAVMDAEEDTVVAEAAVRGMMPDFTVKVVATSLRMDADGVVLPPVIASDRRLREAEKVFSDVLSTLRKERYIRGDEVSLDELLDPQMEREDLDSEFLRFADGDEGTQEIIEYLKKQNEEEDDEEEPQEPEFTFSNKDALAAVDFLRKIVRHRPDLEVALPLEGYLHKFRAEMVQEVENAKVQANITSFFT
ncbi:hypothetical protein C8R45DRAFT_1104380 [Mycena sanguinolenta]|nr:hypothetical protein C8R45DRAFT_1104380 [Mycena sanguinolenta]